MHSQKEKRLSGRHSLFKLAGRMAPFKWGFALCMVLTVAANGAELLKPYVMAVIIDDFLRGGAQQHGWYSVAGMGITYFLLIAAGAVCTLLHTRLINRFGQKILNRLRIEVFSAIEKMSLPAFDRYTSGRLITRATNDIETLDEFYTDIIVNLFRDIVLLVGIVAVMLAMNWRLALVGFAAVPVIALITFSMRRALRRNFKRMKKLIGRINGFFSENIDGMKTVQTFGREKEKYAEFAALDKEYYSTTLLQIRFNSLLRPLMEVVNALAVAALIVYGWRGITGGVLELGVVYAFTTYIKKFFEPINDLAEKYNTIQSAAVSADRVFEILDDTASQEQGGSFLGPVLGTVEFRDVWFAYEGENWVLRGVSFRVEKGEKAAFVGPTGAGKTTIISLISGLYHAQKGQVLVDGVPVEEWELGALRRGVCTVLQEVFLFSGTIAENISLSDPMTEEEIGRAVHLAAADAFVAKQPDGLQTRVAERGSTFSAGERQLISFARAIAHDPAVLVLDEATANIDSNTEQVIQQSIASISNGRTALFIAHRLSTVRDCDRIYVLSGGTIAEQGTHRELLARGGIYSEWCRNLPNVNGIN
ncbi:MAG: ABC transporter ATP-binding protein [Firmicutes bacterium]|nr:ABC transporter ATP-binding protein [Bacillota bacterium]